MNLPDEKREELRDALLRDRDVNLPLDDPLDVSINDIVRALAPLLAGWLAEGEARVKARVEAVTEEGTQRAYFQIALDQMLTIQTCGPGLALVPPHWREQAERVAIVRVPDLRAALDTDAEES